MCRSKKSENVTESEVEESSRGVEEKGERSRYEMMQRSAPGSNKETRSREDDTNESQHQ